MSVTPLPSRGADEDASEVPALRLPSPDELVAWWLRVLGELGRAPFTIYRARKLLTIMARLPDHLEALTVALDRTTSTLEAQLDRVDLRLQELQTSFEAVDVRLGSVDGHMDHVDESVGELTDSITNLLGAIPGARRALRNARRDADAV